MLLPILAALMVFAQAPAAAVTPPASATAPAAEAAPAAPTDPVIVQIDGLMAAWKDKPGDPLRGRLGLSHSSKIARDGEVVFWLQRVESMGCGVDGAGGMRCGVAEYSECYLGIAFAKDGKVRNWRANGGPDACGKFVAILAKP